MEEGRFGVSLTRRGSVEESRTQKVRWDSGRKGYIGVIRRDRARG